MKGAKNFIIPAQQDRCRCVRYLPQVAQGIVKPNSEQGLATKIIEIC
jgi:hypothetical protein